jgi:hypothetical protein
VFQDTRHLFLDSLSSCVETSALSIHEEEQALLQIDGEFKCK